MLSKALYENPYLLAIVIFVLLTAGIAATQTMPRLEDPRITMRNPLILAPFPGASAERVEALIIEPLQEELEEIEEIKSIESNAKAGMGVLFVELDDFVTEGNNQNIFSEIRDAIADVAPTLPEGALPPTFDDKRGAAAFTLLIALHDKQGDTLENPGLLTRLAEELADQLRTIGGTDMVRLYGERQEEILITIDPAVLASLGLTYRDIAGLIAEADSKNSAGLRRGDNTSLLIEVTGSITTLQRLRSIPILERANAPPLLLQDIAAIEKIWQTPPEEVALSQGQQAVYVAARMANKQRIEQWSTITQQILDDFAATYGTNLSLSIVFDQRRYTDERLGNLTANLLAGSVIVMLVVLVFMGWKPSLIVGLALPLAMGGAIFSLSFFDEEIHQMSIFGMIIAIGLVIDNAIVVTDDIRKKTRTQGLPPLEALGTTVTHLRGPLLASTLTTILGFMPIFLLPGNVGDFIGSIAISVVMALILSYFISLLIIAPLAARFSQNTSQNTSQNHDTPDSEHTWWRSGLRAPTLTAWYQRRLEQAMRHPVKALLLSLILPVAGFMLAFGRLEVVFFPGADRDHFEVKVWLPPQSSLAETARLTAEIDAYLRQEPGIERTSWLSGGSHPSVYYNQMMSRDGTPYFAQGIIFAESAKTALTLIPDLQQRLDAAFPRAQIVVRAFGQGPPISAPIQFRLTGPDLETLRLKGEEIRALMQKHPDITQTLASMTAGIPKLYFNIDEQAAALAGYSPGQVASYINDMLEGVTGGALLEATENLPVRVRAPETTRGDMAALRTAPLAHPSQPTGIPLEALGTWELRPTLFQISHKDGERSNLVEAFITPTAAPVSVTQDIQAALDRAGFILPAGYTLSIAGDADEQQEALSLLYTYLPVLLVLMASSLILTFRSVRIALCLGVIAFLSIGLGLMALWLSGLPLGFNPILGSAGLIGVAINDSIVIYAAITSNREAKAGNLRAIAQETLGCGRHVLSTTLTTAAGFLPLLLAGGTFWPPLAVVIAGGILLCLSLALFFTPVSYALLSQRQRRRAVAATPQRQAI